MAPSTLQEQLIKYLTDAHSIEEQALVQRAIKHSGAGTVAVEGQGDDRQLRVRVHDDGVGGAAFGRGSGLVGLKDRVEALGGRIELHSESGAGTTVAVEFPF